MFVSVKLCIAKRKYIIKLLFKNSNLKFQYVFVKNEQNLNQNVLIQPVQRRQFDVKRFDVTVNAVLFFKSLI